MPGQFSSDIDYANGCGDIEEVNIVDQQTCLDDVDRPRAEFEAFILLLYVKPLL